MLTIYSCNNSEKRDFIATYRIDKAVPIDTSKQVRQNVESTKGWTIYLGDENFFNFQGANKTVRGVWVWDKLEGDDQFMDFQVGNEHISGRLNGNIIYFDKPNLLFDNLFDSVTFVKLKSE